ncbi:GspE/PulE family protein [Myxococcota bacterium]|nr:GspE/PulE family protein [Myxococcota bacterium]
MAASEKALLEAAVAGDLIKKSELDDLRSEARRNRLNLLELVSHHGRFPISALYRALSDERSLPFLEEADLVIDSASLRRLPASLVSRKGIVPVQSSSGALFLATSDPDDLPTFRTVNRILSRDFDLAIAEPTAISKAIRRSSVGAYRSPIATNQEASDFDSIDELNRIFTEAWLLRASDIHIEPASDNPRIRLRVDGRLQTYPVEILAADAAGLVSRMKVLADLDIAEQREPQDGGLTYSLGPPANVDIDVRIATVPTRWGERMTIRLLGQETQGLKLDGLGMTNDALARFSNAIEQPNGLLLLTGPTGSGKTTTLYAALRSINRPEINILTVEDPVEYLIDDISQVQVTGKVNFASALRSFLRHDPDVLMVGEIRDGETADIALKAAMTGHLVFSTLHTNDAPSAITRLADIGVERFLLSASLLGIIAQRLVRRLCEKCCSSVRLTQEDQDWLQVTATDVQCMEPVGCPACLGTGYRGRIGIYETLWIDEHIAELIHEGAGEREVARSASGFQTLYEDARNKTLGGVTSVSEVKRIVNRPERSD